MTESSYSDFHNPNGESRVCAPCHLHRTMLSFSNSVACYRTVCGVNLLEDKCLATVIDCRLFNLKCDKTPAGLCDFLFGGMTLLNSVTEHFSRDDRTMKLLSSFVEK